MSNEKGACQTKNTVRVKDEEEKDIIPLDNDDIALLKLYGSGPHHATIKELEDFIKNKVESLNKMAGMKESEMGLAPAIMWDLNSDREVMEKENSLHVARCERIINKGQDDAKYVVSIPDQAKYVVKLGQRVAPEDIEESMRVGLLMGYSKIQIEIPLPPRIDPSVSMMQVEEKPDVTYADVGGIKEQIERIREVVELPLTHPEKYTQLGIDPPKGVLLYGPPGTGKTLLAKAVANRTDACFIRVIGSELVQRYIGEGARMIREIFQLARTKKAAIIFFDEVDAVGGSRGSGSGDDEIQRTMLEMVNQMDGFDSRGNIKVIMATNRPDTLDPALTRPGRMDRKLEIGLPDLEGRTNILRIHSRSLSCEKDIRFELIARLCPNTTGADLRAVCTEAGMFAIRARRKTINEKDFLEAVNKVIKGQHKFSATAKYMVYN
ncbi:26S proteasome regulatory subunit T1 [Angomonas deanei]|uniref:AAA domain (Dynein-related subfamily)/AAA domain (Cdc48 subfamily)/ATPase family associated with various cellular activities (AAA)/AAA+ lid domain containing protein, putative n=1 Tax=Angomonas deanei TaxID=59799 RepID=A0A7G2CEP3_9TRYP|nr:26S proteasome regulatory subunit T1 [Angomonas deanei]CAD2218368.1 AAA domain (dynein-related subfamily)/AAA domain (Cdc48 subfamily)/ATPase family associated with various cellular activities (AAA)/AAA+ lid domain containing protein, putative [Angomonas deanei]|eukprot:EPY33509.1 26S proteasome regulatory subunit T1 [Angomonas deanei]